MNCDLPRPCRLDEADRNGTVVVNGWQADDVDVNNKVGGVQ